uniref:Uncharacterized protein n=1 Tax=Arundo donax TaxID=35708 RepID=A0A0A9BGH8_ARUDO
MFPIRNRFLSFFFSLPLSHPHRNRCSGAQYRA